MGRQLRRVPLDFDWPLLKRWKGFVNPHYSRCPEDGKTCFNGNTAAGRWLDAIARFICVLGDDAAEAQFAEYFEKRGRLYPHPYITSWEVAPTYGMPHEDFERLRAITGDTERALSFAVYAREHPPKLLPLTEELAALVEGLSEQKRGGLGGGSYKVAQKILAAAGITSERWGICPVCEGHANDPACREAYEAWKEEPPPEGPGYQLWETTSEGSPISPVFPDRESFVGYLVGRGYSREAAEKFSDFGWAPTLTVGPDGVKRDIESLVSP